MLLLDSMISSELCERWGGENVGADLGSRRQNGALCWQRLVWGPSLYILNLVTFDVNGHLLLWCSLFLQDLLGRKGHFQVSLLSHTCKRRHNSLVLHYWGDADTHRGAQIVLFVILSVSDVSLRLVWCHGWWCEPPLTFVPGAAAPHPAALARSPGHEGGQWSQLSLCVHSHHLPTVAALETHSLAVTHDTQLYRALKHEVSEITRCRMKTILVGLDLLWHHPPEISSLLWCWDDLNLGLDTIRCVPGLC